MQIISKTIGNRLNIAHSSIFGNPSPPLVTLYNTMFYVLEKNVLVAATEKFYTNYRFHPSSKD